MVCGTVTLPLGSYAFAELAFFCTQGGLKLRLIKLNWQKSMCSRVKATDEQAKADVKVSKN